MSRKKSTKKNVDDMLNTEELGGLKEILGQGRERGASDDSTGQEVSP